MITNDQILILFTWFIQPWHLESAVKDQVLTHNKVIGWDWKYTFQDLVQELNKTEAQTDWFRNPVPHCWGHAWYHLASELWITYLPEIPSSIKLQEICDSGGRHLPSSPAHWTLETSVPCLRTLTGLTSQCVWILMHPKTWRPLQRMLGGVGWGGWLLNSLSTKRKTKCERRRKKRMVCRHRSLLINWQQQIWWKWSSQLKNLEI